ncbi:hypothetical protein [Dyella sp. Tek66A03]|uniref:hypothetical protein n=1 Tax=Dyella sp. Tek66A03 TaxID=3458298 RepID=UPI00403E3ADD
MDRFVRHARLNWLVVCAITAYQPAASAAENSSGTCVPILARLLPGEYHYCVAVRDWQHGRDRRGLEEAEYSAEWGEKRAQFELGVDHFNGRRGVKADHPLGLAWLTLASERNDPHYVSILASARAQATPEDQEQAAALVAKMRERYSDAYAVDRAERHYRTELWAIRDQVWSVLLLNPVDPWSDRIAVQIDGLGAVQPMIALRRLQSVGETYFQGWGGHVTVEPLVPVTNPSGSSSSAQPSAAHH